MADKNDAAEKPKPVKYVIDRPVYHTPGEAPHAIGSEQEFLEKDVAHLVQIGFMHRSGTEPLLNAVAVGQQQISQPVGQQTVPPPMPAAPLNYQTKPPATS